MHFRAQSGQGVKRPIKQYITKDRSCNLKINKYLRAIIISAFALCIALLPAAAFAGDFIELDEFTIRMQLPDGWYGFVSGQDELAPAFSLQELDKETLESFFANYGGIIYAVSEDGKGSLNIVTDVVSDSNIGDRSDKSIAGLMKNNYGMRMLGSYLTDSTEEIVEANGVKYLKISGTGTGDVPSHHDYLGTIRNSRLYLISFDFEQGGTYEDTVMEVINGIKLPDEAPDKFNWTPVIGIIGFGILGYVFFKVGPNKRKKNQWFY